MQKVTKMNIISLSGTDKRLYPLVGPLVMNPSVLRQNLNFPFRTSERFSWFVAVEGETAIAFLPVERKAGEWVINNYYVPKEHIELLIKLLKKALGTLKADRPVSVISFLKDEELFRQQGFKEEKRWTRYVKMKKELKDE